MHFAFASLYGWFSVICFLKKLRTNSLRKNELINLQRGLHFSCFSHPVSNTNTHSMRWTRGHGKNAIVIWSRLNYKAFRRKYGLGCVFRVMMVISIKSLFDASWSMQAIIYLTGMLVHTFILCNSAYLTVDVLISFRSILRFTFLLLFCY